MANETTSDRFPNWKNVFISILENQIEKVLGENAIEEIKKPLLKKGLNEKLGDIYDLVETEFLRQVEDNDVRDAVINLPIASLPSIQQALGEFFQKPQSGKLAIILKNQLMKDYPNLPEERIGSAVRLYVRILQNEMMPLSEEFQRITTAYSVAQISDHTRNLETITLLLSELLDQIKDTGRAPLSEITDNSKYQRAELILDGEFGEFTSNRLQDLAVSLAVILRTDQSNVRILKVHQGSIVIVIEIPENAANLLYELATEQDFRLMELGVRSITIENRKTIHLSINQSNTSKNELTGIPFSLHNPKLEAAMSKKDGERIDFVIVTALEEERDALLAKLPGHRKLPPSESDTNIYYQVGLPISYPDKSTGIYNIIVLPLLGMGRLQAATATTNAIQRWRPRYVLLVGIAGGVGVRGVKIGDILISDQIVDYELQKITPKGPEIRWEVYRSDPRLLGASKGLSSDEWKKYLSAIYPDVGQSKRHIGPIASGDKVVAFGKILDRYRTVWSKLIGVEMEASGVAMAAFQSATPPGFFMVRAVSDLADENKGVSSVEDMRPFACDAAAAYTIALLQSGPVPPSTPTGSIRDRVNIRINPDLVNYKNYPWQPFVSFRYLESLDSTRFNNMTQSPQIRVLSAKSELLDTLLFGDAIALSENQIIDSRGAIESLSELIEGAKEVGVKIPIRVASRIPNQSVFTLMSQRIGNIDNGQIDKRFVISANPALDLDIDRRKQWSEYLAQGFQGLGGILKRSSSSEAEFVNNWFTALDYVDNVSGLLVGARNIPDRFPQELKQILDLTPGDLIDMCSQTKDANIPEIMHPQWFINKEEAAAAEKIISGLRIIVDQIGGIPNARSPIYTKLAELEKTEPLLVEGIREIVDSIYNFTLGLAVYADSLSDTTGGDTRNVLVRAGHALSQWVRQTEKNSDGGYVYELPWAWGGASQMTWSNKIEPEKINKVIRDVPWRAILEATKEPSWKASLANYRTAVDSLQSIDRNSISLGAMGKEWRQNHHDAHKSLNEAWQKHIEISARLISNQVWKLTSDGIQYHLPEEGNRPLQVTQNSRTMGTAADYSVEMPLFRTNVIQKMEFEQNIFGAINEIAQKRQH